MDTLPPSTAQTPRAPCATADMTPLELGEWFHDEMFGIAERLGLAHDHHEDDDYHNDAAGTAIRIAFAGDPAGGVELFKLIGAQRGWEPVRLLCADPVLITAGPAAVYLRPEGLDVVPLQSTPGRDAATFIDDDDCTVEFEWINANTFGHIRVKRAWSRETKARVLTAVDSAVRRHGGTVFASSPAPHGGDVRKHAKWVGMAGFVHVLDFVQADGGRQAVYGRRQDGDRSTPQPVPALANPHAALKAWGARRGSGPECPQEVTGTRQEAATAGTHQLHPAIINALLRRRAGP